MIITAGGGFSNSTKILQEEYAGGIPILSLLHGCSEGVVGVAFPDKPEHFSYVVIPELAFYEFIPEEHCDDEDPNTLFLEEVSNACNISFIPLGNQSYSDVSHYRLLSYQKYNHVLCFLLTDPDSDSDSDSDYIFDNAM